MNREQLQAAGLSDEQITAVLEGFKGFVPPSRFNEVNEAKKQAEALIKERDKQLEDLKSNLGSQEDLGKQIEALQMENKAAKEQYEKALNDVKRDNAIEMALAQSGARNIKAVKALLDMESIKLDGDKLDGFDAQLKSLLKDDSTSFMFKEKTQSAAPTGMKAAEGTPQLSKPVHEMNYSERVAYLAGGGQL